MERGWTGSEVRRLLRSEGTLLHLERSGPHRGNAGPGICPVRRAGSLDASSCGGVPVAALAVGVATPRPGGSMRNSSMRNSWIAVGLLGAATVAVPLTIADAYTIETHFTKGCHEQLTSQALRSARVALSLPATPPASSNDQALIDDVQFNPEGDM